MGQLLSRAVRRFTQCSSPVSRRAVQQSQEEQQQEQQQRSRQDDTLNAADRPVSQAIPVGQSIDSAEYSAFRDARSEPASAQEAGALAVPAAASGAAAAAATDSTRRATKEPLANNGAETIKTTTTPTNSDKPKEVEEAVIKIQALVRGHLTRKALKDAHQQHSSLPAPGQLGQSHFDEATLTKTQPSAVLSSSSPLGHAVPATAPVLAAGQARSPLESIAELAELSGGKRAAVRQSLAPASDTAPDMGSAGTDPAAATVQVSVQEHVDAEADADADADGNSNANRREQASTSPGARRAMLGRRASPAKLQMPERAGSLLRADSRDSATSTPGEAGASIDLGSPGYCGTPASVSIDILDHHLQPQAQAAAAGMASVLHHRLEEAVRQSPEVGRRAHGPAEQTATAGAPLCQTEPLSSELLAPGAAGQGHAHALAAVRVGVAGPDSDSAGARGEEAEAEAAAIRIQSAFRGYRTRKNSPYRTRSPGANSQGSAFSGAADASPPPLLGVAQKRDALRPQEAVRGDEDDDDEGGVERGGPALQPAELARDADELVAAAAASRQSRARGRDQSPKSADETTSGRASHSGPAEQLEEHLPEAIQQELQELLEEPAEGELRALTPIQGREGAGTEEPERPFDVASFDEVTVREAPSLRLAGTETATETATATETDAEAALASEVSEMSAALEAAASSVAPAGSEGPRRDTVDSIDSVSMLGALQGLTDEPLPDGASPADEDGSPIGGARPSSPIGGTGAHRKRPELELEMELERAERELVDELAGEVLGSSAGGQLEAVRDAEGALAPEGDRPLATGDSSAGESDNENEKENEDSEVDNDGELDEADEEEGSSSGKKPRRQQQSALAKQQAGKQQPANKRRQNRNKRKGKK